MLGELKFKKYIREKPGISYNATRQGREALEKKRVGR